jgi:hypothetical protein
LAIGRDARVLWVFVAHGNRVVMGVECVTRCALWCAVKEILADVTVAQLVLKGATKKASKAGNI